MIITRKIKSRFGTGTDAIRTAERGSLVPVGAKILLREVSTSEVGSGTAQQIGTYWRFRESGDLLYLEVEVAGTWTIQRTFERPLC